MILIVATLKDGGMEGWRGWRRRKGGGRVMERWRDGRMVEGERMEGWKDGRMEGWRDGRMEGWRDGGMELMEVMERWRDGRRVEGERAECGDGGMEGWKGGDMEGWRDGRIILISKSKWKKEQKCQKLSLDVVKTMRFTVFL